MSRAADRNLLFGILALQMDFISRDALIAGMNAWVLEKSQSLGKILVAQGALDADHLAWLDAGVERHLAKHNNDAQQSLAALSSVGPARKDLEKLADADIQASLVVVARRQDNEADPHPTRMPSVGAASTIGERFCILRPHAEGGLGKVSVALDGELRREVALKEIKERHAGDPGCRGRFVLEAEITGGLEHPGIVPVYGLGVYADGRPFYAMRFIRGDSLKEAIARFHTERTTDTTDHTDKRAPDNSQSVLSVASVVDFFGLAFRQLLGRFIDVCNAVAYAHSRGVLHRDLKPGNVMLGKYGETLVVDWGLAKAAGDKVTRRQGDKVTDLHSPGHPVTWSPGQSTDEPPLQPSSGDCVETIAGSAVGTPQYMSPEQAGGRLDQLGPASDVYSLGATLHTLLTNRPPVEGSDVAVILRAVERGETGFARAAGSASCPAALAAICKKAMALRAADRYATPLLLAEDLEHWLADEPVSAYPEPITVRGRRWMRKHPGSVAAVAAAVLVGVVGLTLGAILLGEKNRELSGANQALGTANQKLDAANADLTTTNEKLDTANRDLRTTNERLDAANLDLKKSNENLELARQDAESKRQQAEDEKQVAFAVRKFLLHHLLRQADPTHQANRTLELDRGRFTTVENPTVKELLDRAAADLAPERIEQAFPGQTRVQAEILGTVGLSYRGVGDYEKAVAHLERSRSLYEKALGPDHVATLTSMHNLATSYQDAGNPAQAARLFEQTLKVSEAKLGRDHPDTLRSMNNLARSYTALGKLDLAASLFEEAFKVAKAKLGADHIDTLTTMGNLAQSWLSARKLDLALPLLEESLALRKAKLGPAHPHTLISMDNLAQAYQAAEKLDLAVPLFEEAVKLSIAKLGRDHPDTLVGMNNLARSYQDAARPDLSTPLFEETFRIQKAKLGAEHPNTLITMSNLAGSYQAAGKFDLALPLFEQTLALRKAKLGDDHPETLLSMGRLAQGFQLSGKLDLAVPLYEESLKLHKAKVGVDHPETLTIMHNLAAAYRSLQKLNLALTLYEETLKLRKATLGPDHTDTLATMSNLARAYQAAGKLDLAKPLLEETLKRTRSKFGADHPRTLTAMANLGAAYLDAKQPDKALPLFHDFLAAQRQQLGADDPGFANIIAQVGQALLKAGQHGEAEKCLRECLAIHEKNEPDAWITFNTRSVLGGALRSQKKYREAEPLLLAGYEGLKQRAAAIPPQIKDARLNEAASQLVQLFEATRTSKDQNLEGALNDEKTEAAHEVKLSAGKPVVIEMRSRRFDTYLRLLDENGKTLDENDDADPAAKNQNSRILIVLRTDRLVRIIATSPGGRGRGEYEIIIREYGAAK